MLLIYQETELAIGIVVSARNSSALGDALLLSPLSIGGQASLAGTLSVA